MIGDGSTTAVALEESYERRRVPCICPRQFERAPPVGIPTEIKFTRGVVVEAVTCSTCDRRWKRVNA